jgi:hypothetical protein
MKNAEQYNSDHVDCKEVRTDFPSYLDGALSGVAMASLARHLEDCVECSTEFVAQRSVQQALSDLKPMRAPADLERRLRSAIAIERERGSYLSPLQRLRAAWQSDLGPAAYRFAGGLAAAIVLVAGISALFAAPIAVEANDDLMAHYTAPHYLYSQMAEQAIPTSHDAPLLVEAKIDASGRAYDFNILEGPDTPEIRLGIERNLLTSVFKPATVFGAPVRGQMVITYTTVSVRG